MKPKIHYNSTFNQPILEEIEINKIKTDKAKIFCPNFIFNKYFLINTYEQVHFYDLEKKIIEYTFPKNCSKIEKINENQLLMIDTKKNEGYIFNFKEKEIAKTFPIENVKTLFCIKGEKMILLDEEYLVIIEKGEKEVHTVKYGEEDGKSPQVVQVNEQIIGVIQYVLGSTFIKLLDLTTKQIITIIKKHKVFINLKSGKIEKYFSKGKHIGVYVKKVQVVNGIQVQPMRFFRT